MNSEVGPDVVPEGGTMLRLKMWPAKSLVELNSDHFNHIPMFHFFTNTASGQRIAGLIEKETVPFWCSFIRGAKDAKF